MHLFVCIRYLLIMLNPCIRVTCTSLLTSCPASVLCISVCKYDPSTRSKNTCINNGVSRSYFLSKALKPFAGGAVEPPAIPVQVA